MTALGWDCKGRKIRTVGRSETTSSDSRNKRRGGNSVATDLIKNINISLP
jgi:hypothetical protein